MPFGQQSGPPASAQQVKRLLALLQDAGYDSWRDARGPLRLTQRQAGGKFTRDEADALIERLETDAEAEASDVTSTGTGDGTDTQERRSTAAPRKTATPTTPATPRLTAAERALHDMPDALLAAELQRRGWIVVEP